MIDFHCHLDLFHDPQSLLRKVVERKCYVLAVTTTPLAWEGTCALVGSSPRVEVAIGLHPELAATRYGEIDQFRTILSKSLYVGEIGLDGARSNRSSLSLQCQVFESVLSACESVGGRIMTIHSRGATALVLDHLEAYSESGVPVMHWFSGTHVELKRAIEMGCWFSIGPAMLRGKKGRALASRMPLDRVLTETDGPIAQRGGKPFMPWDVKEVETTLGVLWKLSATAVQRQLSANFHRLVKIGEGETTVVSNFRQGKFRSFE